MHPMAAMFRGRIGRDGAVIGLAENRASVGGGSRHGSEDIGVGRFFAEGFLAILRCTVDRAVAAVGGAVGQATRRRWRGLAEDEKLDEGANQKDDRKLTEEKALCKRQSWEQG